MPLDPEPVVQPPVEPSPQEPPYRWYHKLAALLFVIFCLELGIFLAVFPWLDAWDINWFATFTPAFHQIWMNPFFRGALSGIGVVNVYISMAEVSHLRRFAAGKRTS